MEAMISRYGYFLMMKFSKRIRKAIYQESKGAALMKKKSKDCSSLLRIKNNYIMCLDTAKNTYISADGINKDCFKRINGIDSHHALCPWRSDAVIKLVGAYSHTDGYSAELHHSLQSNNHKTHLRQRRSQYIDPSDPLGSENPRSKTANYRRPNQDQERSSNVSKETITSCDDPLHVLFSKSPVSPNLQKQKKNQQVAPSDSF
ncbi:hypothetical protein QQF64_022833 [Cirrhinus molitorella]